MNNSSESKTFDVQMRWGVTIPLRDGVELAATLYLPIQHESSSPAIFTLTPYVGQMWHDFAVYFASHGYPFLTVDARGRGNSQGMFRPYINDARDGYDVVEWLAKQPYCNGRVAMWGGSYGGFNQWRTAKEQPPHLATIVPAAAAYPSVDVPFRNNISSPYFVEWLTLVAGRTSQERMFFKSEAFWGAQFRRCFEAGIAFKQIDSFLGVPSAAFQEWLEHPRPDEYWDRVNPTNEEYSRLKIPILTITGSYDGDQPGALEHYRKHLKGIPSSARVCHYLVIGPWDHSGTRIPSSEFGGLRCGPASLVDLRKLHLEWYAWVMQSGPKPEFLKSNVAYYVMGADLWRYADSLEQITSHHDTMYLSSNSNPTDIFDSGYLMPTEAAAETADYYIYDPTDVSLAALESKVDPENWADQRMVIASAGRQLVYHTAPFDASKEVSGFFRLRVWLSIDQPDTDFQASIYEIAVDGSSILLTRDSIRARYRQGLRDERLITTQEPLQYDFEGFMFVSRYLERGNRLRLVIGPPNSIYVQKNFNSGREVAEESFADARTVTVRLFHDARYPSALYLPIGRSQKSASGAA